MRICVGRFYANDESSLVVFVQHLQYCSGVVLRGELYAKPNGRLVDYGSYRIHDSSDWKEYDTLEGALRGIQNGAFMDFYNTTIKGDNNENNASMQNNVF